MTERRFVGNNWATSEDGTTWHREVDGGDRQQTWVSADVVNDLSRRNHSQGLHMAVLEAQVVHLEAVLRELHEGGTP